MQNNETQKQELSKMINHYSNKKLKDISDKDMENADKFLKIYYTTRIKAKDYGADK